MGCRRDHRGDRSDDASLAGEVGGARLFGTGRWTERETELKARATGRRGRGLRLHQETYYDLRIKHFHEKLRAEHKIEVSYTWVRLALQGAGLVAKARKRGKHRNRRERRPIAGMLLRYRRKQTSVAREPALARFDRDSS